METLTVEIAASLLTGALAVAEDLWRRQISNWTSVSALVSGLAIGVWSGGWAGLGTSLLGATAGFAVFFLFYLLGGMGGGDIKLMAGFGAILGPSRIWMGAWWAAILGGVLAAGVLVWRRRRGLPVRGASIPYAPALALGVWMALAGSQ